MNNKHSNNTRGKFTVAAQVLLIFALTALVVSCVTTGQYNAVRGDLEAANASIERLNTILREAVIVNNANANKRMMLEQALLKERAQIETLKTQNEALLTGGADELLRQSEKRQKELDAAYKRRLTELGYLCTCDQVVASIRQNVARAVDMNALGLMITVSGELVYVSMENRALYDTGKSYLHHRGTAAITKLARFLRTNPHVYAMIEVNIDLPARPTDSPGDNMELGVSRAKRIRELMINESIKPERLLLTSDGDINLPENDGNGHTVIILSPNKNALGQLSENRICNY